VPKIWRIHQCPRIEWYINTTTSNATRVPVIHLGGLGVYPRVYAKRVVRWDFQVSNFTLSTRRTKTRYVIHGILLTKSSYNTHSCQGMRTEDGLQFSQPPAPGGSIGTGELQVSWMEFLDCSLSRGGPLLSDYVSLASVAGERENNEFVEITRWALGENVEVFEEH